MTLKVLYTAATTNALTHLAINNESYADMKQFAWPDFESMTKTQELLTEVTGLRRAFVFCEMIAPFDFKPEDGPAEANMLMAYDYFIKNLRHLRDLHDGHFSKPENYGGDGLKGHSHFVRARWQDFEKEFLYWNGSRTDSSAQQRAISFLAQIKNFLFLEGMADRSYSSGVIGRIEDMFQLLTYPDKRDPLVTYTHDKTVEHMLRGEKMTFHDRICDIAPMQRLFIIKRNMQIAEVASIGVGMNHEYEYYMEIETYMNKSCGYGKDFRLEDIRPNSAYYNANTVSPAGFLTGTFREIEAAHIRSFPKKESAKFNRSTSTLIRGVNGRKLYTANKTLNNKEGFDDGRTIHDVVGLMFCSHDAFFCPEKDLAKLVNSKTPEQHCLQMIKNVRMLGENLSEQKITELCGVESSLALRTEAEKKRRAEAKLKHQTALQEYVRAGGLLL